MPEGPGLFAVVIAGAAMAGLVQGLSGFAFSMVALSFWAWALTPETAAPLAVFGSLLGQVASLGSIRGGFDLRKIAPLVLGGLVGVPIGVFLLHNVDPQRFRLVVGAFLMLYGGYGLLARRPPTLAWGGGGGLDALMGGVGGVLGGLGGMSGAVPAIWTQLRGWSRDLRRATMQVYNIAMHCTTLVVYARTGSLNPTATHLFLVVAPAMLIPSYLGARWYGRFSEQTFTKMILALLVCSGAALVYGAATTIWVKA